MASTLEAHNIHTRPLSARLLDNAGVVAHPLQRIGYHGKTPTPATSHIFNPAAFRSIFMQDNPNLHVALTSMPGPHTVK